MREAEPTGEDVFPTVENIPKMLLFPPSAIDPAIIIILSADPETTTIGPYG